MKVCPYCGKGIEIGCNNPVCVKQYKYAESISDPAAIAERNSIQKIKEAASDNWIFYSEEMEAMYQSLLADHFYTYGYVPTTVAERVPALT